MTYLQGYPINHPNSMFISKIMGGREARPHELPFQVHLQYNSNFHCGGVIISPLLILTVAHCVYEKQADKFRVIAGDHNRNDRSGNEQERAVSRIIIHEQYDPMTTENDIALMLLSSPVNFNTYVNKVEYKHPPANWSGSATVSGWGQLVSTSPSYNKLQKVDVPIVPNADCAKHYGLNRVKSKMFCAGIPGKDACRGDSGGPLSGYLVSSGLRIVVGLVSFGQLCVPQEHKQPGVYTNISKYGTWIDQAIAKTKNNANNNCKLDQFYCAAQNKCIPSRWICDGDRDCNDGSDENTKICHCKGKLICKSGNKCISPLWKCDNDKDCPGGEDELDCSFG